MPDNTDLQLPGEVFERNVAVLAPPPPVDAKRGIIFPGKYKSYVVNIRPSTWRERIWIGQIDNYEDAQYIAELVFYYIGHQCVHLQNANFEFPPLECAGTQTPLASREMCYEYAMSISKGPEFKSLREEFIEKVKNLALEKVTSVAVQRVLQQFRDLRGLAVVVGNDDNDEGVQSEQLLEGDDSKHLPIALASHEGLTRNVDGWNAHVPGFDMSDSGFQLQSTLTPVQCSWLDAYVAGFEDYDGRLNHDAEDFCSATGVREELSSDCHLANENFALNFFALGDAADF